MNKLKYYIKKHIRYSLLLKTIFRKTFYAEKTLKFTCNICGKKSLSTFSQLTGRETTSCYNCGSTLRFRSIIEVLSLELYRDSLPLPNFPSSKKLVGIGMSDSEIYAKPLSKIFSYINTFLNTTPILDIVNLDSKWENFADFIITSDVFEHVNPPVSSSFTNLLKILKRGGIVIFTVPYTVEGVSKEHYPNLFDFQIKKQNGINKLYNRTKNGEIEIFENLQWHGGPGQTLEMREFTEKSLLDQLSEAGFIDIKIYDEDYPEFGIINYSKDSLIISMKKN